jgi:hypothetical protein
MLVSAGSGVWATTSYSVPLFGSNQKDGVVWHHRDPVERLGLGVLHVVDGRLRNALVGQGDAACHLLRLQAGVTPDGRDNRDVDGGKDVDSRARDGQHTHQEDQDRENQKGIRPLERDFDDPHAGRAEA